VGKEGRKGEGNERKWRGRGAKGRRRNMRKGNEKRAETPQSPPLSTLEP